MTSKTSFFSKAVFKKNMALYWPIPVCYLLYGLIKVPGVFWSGLRQSARSGKDVLATLFSCLSIQSDLFIVAAVAVITGMAMFGYLFSAKSANMIHALPVTRTQLYVTNVISGLICILIPQFLVFVVSVVLCLIRGLTCVQYLASWLFAVAAAGVFFYSLACFCVMLTGLLVALPVCFVLLNYLSIGMMMGIRYVLVFLGYGLTSGQTGVKSVSYMMSPLACLTEIVGFRVKYMMDNRGQTSVVAASFEGTEVLLAYVVAALFLYVLAWYGYQKRKLEHTGDMLAFGWAKPLFRWGFGAAAGFCVGIVISNFLRSVSIWVSDPVVLLFILVMGIVGFFIADMLVQKSFRVFRIRRVRECGLFVLGMTAGFGLLYGVGCYELKYIPDEDDISCAYVYMNYPVELKGTDVKKAIDIHREIIANKNELERTSRGQKNCAYLTLNYCLKDGRTVERVYRIFSEAEAAGELAEKVMACEYEADGYLKYTVGCDYNRISSVDGAQVECQGKNKNYVSFSIDEEAAGEIYKAFCQDVKNGSIQKYNLENYMLDPEGTIGKYPSAYLTIYFEHASTTWEDVYSIYQEKTKYAEPGSKEDYETYPDASGSIYVKFGVDCTNIMKALVKTGVISSADEIIFSSDSETTMG